MRSSARTQSVCRYPREHEMSLTAGHVHVRTGSAPSRAPRSLHITHLCCDSKVIPGEPGGLQQALCVHRQPVQSTSRRDKPHSHLDQDGQELPFATAFRCFNQQPELQAPRRIVVYYFGCVCSPSVGPTALSLSHRFRPANQNQKPTTSTG